MMKRKTMCWVLTMAFLAWCVPAFSLAAEEKTLDLAGGSITITETKYVQNGQETPYSGAYRIKQSGGQTTNTITVQSGDIAMTLENVNMAEGAGKMPPIADESGAHLTLTLTGENTLTTASHGVSAADAIRVPEGARLTVKGEGKLTAETQGGACIGVSTGKSGTIRIEGGVIEATNRDGAAIGGGYSAVAGPIYICSGQVTVHGYGNTAAIGGGGLNKAGAELIEISGGTVYAQAHGGASTAIGAGASGPFGTIRITGGQVTAVAGYGNAMGSGMYSETDTAEGKIELLGGTLTTKGTVGGMNWPAADSLTINGVVWYGDAGNAETFSKAQNPTGLFFNGQAGTVYGQMKLTGDLTIEKDQTLTLPQGSQLIENGHKLSCLGKLEGDGALQLDTLTLRLSAKANEPLKAGDTVALTATLDRALADAEIQFMVNGQAIGTPTAVGEDAQTAEATYLVRTPSTYTFTAKMSYHGVAVESEKPVQLTLAEEGAAPTATPQTTPAQTNPPAATQTPGGVSTGDGSLPMWVLWAVLGVAAVGGGVVLYQKIKRD